MSLEKNEIISPKTGRQFAMTTSAQNVDCLLNGIK